jgi:CMP-N-acetylneuraminic acid synthetase/regulator of RNase E activity RraA
LIFFAYSFKVLQNGELIIMKTAIFLPAKGTSSRIESKNIQLLDGKPLFLYTLEKLVKSNCCDEIWLDTDSDDIIDLASHINCKVLKRDPNLANNKTDGHALFLNEVKHTDADIVIQILGTSPFIEISSIEKSIRILKESEHDSVVMVNKEKIYTWNQNGPNYNLNSIPNSNDLDDTIIETMGLYAVKRDSALSTKRRIGNNPYLLDCSPIEAIDVNYPEEFHLANLIAAGRREEDRKLLNNIKSHLSSPIISDVMDDLGVDENQMLFGLKANIPNRKILGRSKTLRLKEMQEDDDFRGIYTALESYKTIIPNDIIVVENAVPDFAYFGELNANLAIRCGAGGAIIGGKTRDNPAVEGLDFPTFSTGYVARDVRKRAVTDTINKPINVFGTPVSPGDLIFGDNEGVAVIPQEREEEILNEIFERVKTEKTILFDIANGVDVKKLVDEHGAF